MNGDGTNLAKILCATALSDACGVKFESPNREALESCENGRHGPKPGART